MPSKLGFALVPLLLALVPAAAAAGEADVLDAQVTAAGDGKFRFDVTVQHEDTGWDHYADGWDVVAPDGTVLGTRILLHPHVGEQSFTRSEVIAIPDGIDTVTIRAHDKVDEYGGKTLDLKVPR
jgi:hypothetical protein